EHRANIANVARHRAQRRCELREHLNGLSADERQQAIIHAQADTRALAPPHQTFDEWKAKRDAHASESEASRRDVRRRALATHITITNGTASATGATANSNGHTAKD